MNKNLILTILLVVSLQISVNAKDWTSIEVRNSGGYIARFEVSYIVGSDPDIITEPSGNFPGKI